MSKNKIYGAMAIAVVLTVAAIIFNHTGKNSDPAKPESEESYRAQLQKIEQDNHWKAVSNEAVKNYLLLSKNFTEQNVKAQFAGGVVNQDTLNFFRFLDNLFKNAKDAPDSLEQARKYLFSVLPPDRAGQMLELYKKYINYQIGRQSNFRGVMKTGKPDEALVNFEKIKAERRAVFGREDADIIFSASEKTEEYTIRRQMILADENLSGLEKERRLRLLHDAMWGEEAMPFDVNSSAYSRYQEKLIIYQKDLASARTDAEREAMLEKFRREIFTPDELQRMEEAKSASSKEAKLKENYYAREKEILNNTAISREVKDMKIRELQDETFGEEAEPFRRQQDIQKGLEELKQKQALEAKSLPQNTTLEDAVKHATQKMQDAQRELEVRKSLE